MIGKHRRFFAPGLVVFGALVSVLILSTLGSLFAAAPAPAQRPGKPNIIFILTDDEDAAIHRFMPKTKALLGDRGTTFSNFFVTYPFCCPSRASILRGQYAHNTRILGNIPPLGGFAKFRDLGLEGSTVATWLQAAGYRTVFLGKYLNGYGDAGTEKHVPPAWTEWYAGTKGAYQNFNYKMNENGRIVSYGSAPGDYLVDVLARKTVDTIRRAAQASQPIFVYVAPFTPHWPAAPAPRHETLYRDARLPRPPSFNEADVSDKAGIVLRRPVLSERQITELEKEYRRRLQSLQAIDDLVATVVRVLQEMGTLNNSYIVYTSDNGYHMGEHRLTAGKSTAYEEDIRVPFVLRGPRVPAGKTVDALALNIDIAPTFAEIAGAARPAFVDGRSLLPLLSDEPPTWRKSFAVQFRSKEEGEAGTGRDPRRPSWNAIRTQGWTYIEWLNGDRELYDLRTDRFQLENRARTASPALVRALAARLGDLIKCAGSECRKAEDAPVPRPSGQND